MQLTVPRITWGFGWFIPFIPYIHIQRWTHVSKRIVCLSVTQIGASLFLFLSLFPCTFVLCRLPLPFPLSLSLFLFLYPSCVCVNRFTSFSFVYRKKIDNAYVMYMLRNLLIDIDHNFYLFIHSLATETTDRILNNRMNKV